MISYRNQVLCQISLVHEAGLVELVVGRNSDFPENNRPKAVFDLTRCRSLIKQKRDNTWVNRVAVFESPLP